MANFKDLNGGHSYFEAKRSVALSARLANVVDSKAQKILENAYGPDEYKNQVEERLVAEKQRSTEAEL